MGSDHTRKPTNAEVKVDLERLVQLKDDLTKIVEDYFGDATKPLHYQKFHDAMGVVGAVYSETACNVVPWARLPASDRIAQKGHGQLDTLVSANKDHIEAPLRTYIKLVDKMIKNYAEAEHISMQSLKNAGGDV